MIDETLERTWAEVQGKLLALQAEGYDYLATYDDAVTWRGTEKETGVPIDLLLMLGTFRGNIVANEMSSISPNPIDA